MKKWFSRLIYQKICSISSWHIFATLLFICITYYNIYYENYDNAHVYSIFAFMSLFLYILHKVSKYDEQQVYNNLEDQS